MFHLIGFETYAMTKVSNRIENRKNNPEKSYHVAVAMINERVIATATNSVTEGHAEARLLKQISKSSPREKVDIMVVRIANTSNKGHVKFKNSRPCKNCSEAIGRSGLSIRRVCWSTGDDTMVAVRPREFAPIAFGNGKSNSWKYTPQY